jgi:hypothetical protein
MRRTAIAAILAMGLALTAVSAALAGPPANRACMGEDMSHYARFGFTFLGQPFGPGREFGQFHYFFAQQVFHGMGEPVAIHRSGAVPEGVLDPYHCGE